MFGAAVTQDLTGAEGVASKFLHMLLIGLSSSWAVELRTSGLCWLLARCHSQFVVMWTFP